MTNKYVVDETWYVDKKGKVHHFVVENDEWPEDPRYEFWDDGNIGTMMCWYRGYNLGDYKENNYDDPEDFLNDLMRESHTDKELVEYVQSGRASNNLEIEYEEEDEIYDLVGDFTVWWNGNKIHHGVLASQSDILWLQDDIIEALPIGDKLNLLEKKDYYFLPLAVYEHGGITMWCGSRWNHFDAQWDCSDVGWIYTTKEKVLAQNGNIQNENGEWIKVTDDNWKTAAQQWMKSEVKVYDAYISGQVYGWKDYTLDEDGDDMEGEEESCWGYYGEDDAEEMARDNVGITNFITEPEAMEINDAYWTEVAVMDQCEYLYAT